MQITRYGQSAMLVATNQVRVLLDPGSFSEDEVFLLPDLDALLITHEHADHVDLERLGDIFAVNPEIKAFAPQAVLDAVAGANTVAGWGVDRGIALADDDQFSLGDLEVSVVGELHQLILPEIPRCANIGFVLSVAGADGATGRLFVPGDSYETVPENISTLALPLFGPWSSLPATIEFVRAVAPAQLFPNHDALLSEQGRQLYRRFITQATGSEVRFLDVEAGVPFTI